MKKVENERLISINVESLKPIKMGDTYKIETEHLNAWFGAKHAIKDVSIRIKTNAVTAIIGP